MDETSEVPGLAAFLAPYGVSPADCDVRRLGADAEMVARILAVIGRGEKTMTFSLPWLAEVEGKTPPSAGRCLVLLDADGAPAVLARISEVRTLSFGAVDATHLAREGIPMRDPEAWRDLHRWVWNVRLEPLGRSVADDMPVWAEYFDVLAQVDSPPQS